MIAEIMLEKRSYTIDLAKGTDLSIPFSPHSGARAWGVGDVEISPVRQGDWVGLIREGAAVNFVDIQFNPHGQGTHTECAGHISEEMSSVNAILKEYWFPAYLATVEENMPEGGYVLDEVYAALRENKATALIVRTQPNSAIIKKNKNYSGTNPPFFNPKSMEELANLGVKHFLTDLPSVDPENDGGQLAAHKAFFLDKKSNPRAGATITELIYAPDHCVDGFYLLNLQLAPFDCDASPSRPLIYPLSL